MAKASRKTTHRKTARKPHRRATPKIQRVPPSRYGTSTGAIAYWLGPELPPGFTPLGAIAKAAATKKPSKKLRLALSVMRDTKVFPLGVGGLKDREIQDAIKRRAKNDSRLSALLGTDLRRTIGRAKTFL
jgi:hypothetical protein